MVLFKYKNVLSCNLHTTPNSFVAFVKLEKEVAELREASVRQSKSLKCEEAMMFKLSGYETLKESNESISFLSPSFYTKPDGYLMDIVVYVNGRGYGEGTRVSLSAY